MLKGSIPALVTPFKNGEIDYNSLEKLLKFHLENKSDGLVLLGTTAEAATIAGDEKESLLRFCVQRIKNKIPIIVGTGSNSLTTTIAQTQKAQNLGAEYALIVTPFYNKPNQDGLYLYYSNLAQKIELPIIIYNVPSRTGCNISADTVIKLACKYPDKIIAIKEASGDLVKASQIVRDTPETFTLLSGEDALNYPLMCIGAKGTISVTANIVPLQMHELIMKALNGNCNDALDIHQLLIELNDILFCDSNPIPVKHILAHLGLIDLEFRLPLCPTNDTKIEKIISVYERFITNYNTKNKN